ncbi:hypothetical protein [Candidatus Villigracilis affinis]|uniref:hypothetical protein n=1 Tax=Candidatus Villigracilis affinis TaxID=3140682 RepID=UPI001DA719AD|nr:hypothetical protein [Anaerolineales bacterium]
MAANRSCWGHGVELFTGFPIYQTMERFAPFIGNPADKVVNPAYSPFMLGVLLSLSV